MHDFAVREGTLHEAREAGRRFDAGRHRGAEGAQGEGRGAPGRRVAEQVGLFGARPVGFRGSEARERDGLEVGDVLISADGTSLAGAPMRVLDPLLRTGEAIEFVVERDGGRKTVVVTPNPR